MSEQKDDVFEHIICTIHDIEHHMQTQTRVVKEGIPITQLGTYMDVYPSSLAGPPTIEKYGKDRYYALGYSPLHTRMETMYRTLSYQKKLPVETFCAIVTGLPKQISNLTDMYNELVRLTNILELPSCEISLNFKYTLWRNVVAMIIEVFLDQMHVADANNAHNAHNATTEIIMRTALSDIRGIILAHESESGGPMNIQGSLHIVTRGYSCDKPPTERQNMRSDVPFSIIKNNMASSLLNIDSVKKTLNILEIASAISNRPNMSSALPHSSRDASPKRK